MLTCRCTTRSVLNKITPEKFDRLMEQLLVRRGSHLLRIRADSCGRRREFRLRPR
jgi:hypothetical protein